jgi:peptidyl-prolyl cis-trans isomerase SurA
MAARLRALVFASAVFLSSTSALAGPLVDRLVAVVDRRPIFLSELKERGAPHVKRIHATYTDQTQRDTATAVMYRDLLSRLIDEALVRRDAERLQLAVDDKEIDEGIATVSKSSGMTKEQLQQAVLEQGLSMQQYRDEIARQVLEGKWILVKLRSSPHAPKAGGPEAEYVQAVEKFRRRLLDELRERAYVEVML